MKDNKHSPNIASFRETSASSVSYSRDLPGPMASTVLEPAATYHSPIENNYSTILMT